MRDKNKILNNRLLLTFSLCILIVLAIVLSVTMGITFESTAQSLSSQAEQFTQSDFFNYHNNQYSIQSYKDSISNENSELFGATVAYNNFTATCTISGEDAITKIIPKEFFVAEITTTFIGKEYGFFVNTKHEAGSSNVKTNNFRSTVLIFDITNNTDLVANKDKAIVSVTNLMELEFISVSSNESHLWRKQSSNSTSYTFSTSIKNNSGMDYVVVPLLDKNYNAVSSKYYLKDISFAGTLQNEQNLNQTDSSYAPSNDIGSFFTRTDYIYNGIQVVHGQWDREDWSNVGEVFLSECVSTALGCIPGVGTVFSVALAGITVVDALKEATADKWFDASNDNFIMQGFYSNRDDQIKYDGNLSKSAALAINSSSDLTLLYAQDDSARIEYTISHSALNGQVAEYTRFSSEIALKVVDENFNEYSIAHSSNDLFLREEEYNNINIADDNNVYLLKNGTNCFSFTPTYSGNYIFTVNSAEKLRLTINNQIFQGTNISAKIKLTQNKKYSIVIENMSASRIITKLSLGVDTAKTDIQLNGNDNHIIEINNLQGFYKLAFSNTNAQFSILDANFKTVKDNGTNISYYPFANQTYYVVIENPSATVISGNLTVLKESTLLKVGDTKEQNVLKGDLYYKFAAQKNNTYSFLVFKNTTAQFTVKMFADNGDEISPTICFGNSYTRYDYTLKANHIYYFGYSNVDRSAGSFKTSVCQDANIYQFFIDDKPIADSITMTQNQTFKLQVKVNDILLNDVEYIVGGINYIDKISTWNYRILPNAPVSRSNLCRISVIDSNNKSLKSISLVIIPKFTIKIETYSTATAVKNKIKWTFTSTSTKYNIAFILELCYNDNKVLTVNVSGTGSGYVDIPINNYPDSNFAVAKTRIKNLTFTQYWSSQGSTEQYSVRFYNDYYANTSGLGEHPFILEPFELNMLFAGGDGTATRPFEIKNGLQLQNMKYMAVAGNGDYESERWIMGNYVLKNNITTTLESLPALRGSLIGADGIKEIIITTLTGNDIYAGLFKKIILGRVENIKVIIENDASNSRYKGSISGYMVDGTVSDCVAFGNFTNYSKNVLSSAVGGIVGEMISGVIVGCESRVNISTYGDAGGIVGVQYQGNIIDCTYSGAIRLNYSLKSITSVEDNVAVGGIVGRMYYGRIRNNSVTCTIEYVGEKCNEKELKPCIGNFVGRNMSGGGYIEGSTENINSTINTATLGESKGFLGIGKYNQLEYVSKNKAFWGRGD